MNLKPYLDAVNAANETVLKAAQEIDAVFNDGPEGPEKAYAMKPQLDGAMAEAAKARELYQAMQRATADGGTAAKFVPAGEAKPEAKKTITRSEYRAMTPQARHDFFAAGGEMVDDEARE